MYKNLMTFGCAAVLALGLAACGGGGGDDTADAPTTMEPTGPTPAEQIAELQTQINALRAGLGLDPIDINELTGSVAELTEQVAALQKQIDDAADAAEKAAEEAARMAATATGKALFAALADTDATSTPNNPLENIAAPTLGTAGLGIDAAANAGTLTTDPTSVTLKASDSAGALGGWAGTNYALTTGTGASKVTNEAVVYNNKGPGRTVLFSSRNTVETADVGTAPNFTAIKGSVTVVAANLAKVMADAFTHPGQQNHAVNSDTGIFTTRGTYDGAPGVYRCTGTCSSTNDDGKGAPSALGGTWHFKPDAGASAMAHSPDSTYLYYGWWVSKDKDGDPTAASAFVGIVGDGTSIQGGTTALADDPAGLGGSATYAGHAAGKWALDYAQNKVLDGASDAGHFTADIMLTAKFEAAASPTNGGVTGTIDNFRLNDGTEDPGWSVALHRAPWDGTTNGAFASTATDNTTADGTTWSIDGTSAPESGTWSGQMYDEMPGNTDSTPPGDGSNVPTTATGRFYSEFDSVGRMVGAFGANKQ